MPLSPPVVASKLTPKGKMPLSLRLGTGLPVAATVKLFDVPMVNVVALALVMAGA